MEKTMETIWVILGLYWVIENKMETTRNIGVIYRDDRVGFFIRVPSASRFPKQVPHMVNLDQISPPPISDLPFSCRSS